jgi:hypothetical protein
MNLTDSSPHIIRAYAAFGRTIIADRSIPFPESTQTTGAAIELLENHEACSAGPSETAQILHEVEDFRNGPHLQVLRDDSLIWVDYVGYRFCLSPALHTIEYSKVETTRAGVGFDGLIERVVLPLFLLFESPSVAGVHGGSVVIDDQAWVFIGDSGVGKSTTARVLVERGAKLIADDLTLIDQAKRCVLPGCPAVRLWEQEGAVELAIEDRPESVFRDKRWFRLPAACAASAPVSAGGVFVLSPQSHDAEIIEAKFERITGHEAFAELMAQTFDISNPEADWTRQRFQTVAKLARMIPIYRYVFARSSSGEPTHVEALEEFIATSTHEHAK